MMTATSGFLVFCRSEDVGDAVSEAILPETRSKAWRRGWRSVSHSDIVWAVIVTWPIFRPLVPAPLP